MPPQYPRWLTYSGPSGFFQVTGQFHLRHNKFSVNHFYTCVVRPDAQRHTPRTPTLTMVFSSDAASGNGHWAGSGCLNSHGIFPVDSSVRSDTNSGGGRASSSSDEGDTGMRIAYPYPFYTRTNVLRGLLQNIRHGEAGIARQIVGGVFFCSASLFSPGGGINKALR